jgi:spermidine synthase
VNILFEELDYRQTPLGELSLRRRGEPLLNGREVFEIKLGEEFLMSSLFTTGEVALAELGLAELEGSRLDVVVGGLGLGYTADAVLGHDTVQSLLVIEALGDVIDWHRRGLVPLGAKLTADGRCQLVEGDFFAMVTPPSRGFDPKIPDRRFHAVLVDIDHSPSHLLHPRSKSFYEPDGLRRLVTYLHPGGVFALWSNDGPDESFQATLGEVFASTRAQVVSFDNPYTNAESTSTVYIARAASG